MTSFLLYAALLVVLGFLFWFMMKFFRSRDMKEQDSDYSLVEGLGTDLGAEAGTSHKTKGSTESAGDTKWTGDSLKILEYLSSNSHKVDQDTLEDVYNAIESSHLFSHNINVKFSDLFELAPGVVLGICRLAKPGAAKKTESAESTENFMVFVTRPVENAEFKNLITDTFQSVEKAEIVHTFHTAIVKIGRDVRYEDLDDLLRKSTELSAKL